MACRPCQDDQMRLVQLCGTGQTRLTTAAGGNTEPPTAVMQASAARKRGSQNSSQQSNVPREGMPMSTSKTPTTRRKFVLAAGAAGAATIAMPQVSRAQTVTWKYQSTWPT